MNKTKNPENPLVQPLVELSLLEDQKNFDIVRLLPKEIVLKVFSLLSFQDLIRVQLTCKVWRKLALDNFIWRNRFQELNSKFTDIYAHQPSVFLESNKLPWKTRYCQAITFANWRMGTVQSLKKLDHNDGYRLLSVKLKDDLLVTLTEDNTVKLYTYSIDHGFEFKTKWNFGDPNTSNNKVECIDILPEINIIVVAQRGSKCMFFDVNKSSKHDPIQVLKGGNHPWFIPDSISVNQDYFAVSGRKPSVVFVWNWRKGVKLSNRAFDNQPHNVFLSDHHLITVSVDGLLHVFDILDNMKVATSTQYLSPSNIPCIVYDNSLSLILAPFGACRIYRHHWKPRPNPTTTVTLKKKRLSLSHLLGLKPTSNRSVRVRRHSSYNDYGYSCQLTTDRYIKQLTVQSKPSLPDFQERPRLLQSIRTTPLANTAKDIVNLAVSGNRVATVNRQGDIALYALNGTTAARVSFESDPWMDQEGAREGDDLSDGYDVVRSRLAMGPMGLIYGSKNGSLWWLDFGCRLLESK